ncbi:hypothetical protein VSO92_13105 [Myroides pelagicus]|nr:hypothetical protein [Myroides pelagicus]MEC4115039.1 hypothetical protein [Myroides pelagicus]
MKVVNEHNIGITGAELVFEGQPIGIYSDNGVIKFRINREGSYIVKAKFNSVLSNEIYIVINDKTAAVGKGQFIYDNRLYVCKRSVTTFTGIYHDGDTVLAGWREEIYSISGTMALFVYFTAAEKTGVNGYKPILPNNDNTILAYGAVLDSKGKILGKTEKQGQIKVSYSINNIADNLVTGEFNTSFGIINGVEFLGTFSGEHEFIVKGESNVFFTSSNVDHAINVFAEGKKNQAKNRIVERIY